MMKGKRWAALLLGAVLLLSGCGNGGIEIETTEADGAEPLADRFTPVWRMEEYALPEGHEIFPWVEAKLEHGTLRLITECVEEDGGVSYFLYLESLSGGEPELTKLEIPSDLQMAQGALGSNRLIFTVNEEAAPGEQRFVRDLYVYEFDRGLAMTLADIGKSVFENDGRSDRFIFRDIEVDGDGNIYLLDDTSVVVLDGEGNRIFQKEASLPLKLLRDTDGAVYYVDGPSLRSIDLSLGQAEIAPASVPARTKATDYAFGVGYDLFYYNDTGLYGLREEAETLLVNWEKSDLSAGEVKWILPASEERFIALYGAEDAAGGKLCTLTKGEEGDIPAETP